jgi:hypothetical protein
LHAVAPHTNGLHVVVAPAVHAPAPLHLPSACATPDAHVAAPHDVAFVGYVHAVVSTPLQLPPHDEPSVVHAARAGVPPVFGVPLIATQLPEALHAWHWPVHAALQQTPSAQKPLLHWLPPLHDAPSAPLPTHVVPLHQSPAMQSASPAHAVLHAPDAHT